MLRKRKKENRQPKGVLRSGGPFLLEHCELAFLFLGPGHTTIELLYGPGIASPGLARVRDIVHTVCLYNILTGHFTSQSSSRSVTAILGLRRAPGRGAVRRRHKSDHRAPGRGRANRGPTRRMHCAYHLDLSTGACGAVVRRCCSHLDGSEHERERPRTTLRERLSQHWARDWRALGLALKLRRSCRAQVTVSAIFLVGF